jgi:DNA polymerase-3 subunit gamma/tau
VPDRSPALASPPPPDSAPASPAAAARGSAAVDLAQLWREVLEAVGRASPFTKSYLLEAHPVSLVKNVFTIGFDPEFADKLELVNNPKNQALLQTKLAELGHPNTQIKFIKSDAPAEWAGAAAAPAETAPVSAPAPAGPVSAPKPLPAAAPSKREKPAGPGLSAEEFKNDPLIQKALEIFKGQIVEVRS